MSRNREIVKYSIYGIVLNLLLSSSKIVVGLFVFSISMILDGVNNLTDALSSLITIIGIKLSAKKPDKKHPYGHGRIEYLTSIAIGIIILFSGIMAIYESVKKIIEPVESNHKAYSLILIAVAIIVKLVFGLILKKKGKQLNSTSLKGSGVDAIGDALLSGTVLVGAIVSLLTSFSIEGYLGVLIGIFIIKSAISILFDSFNDVIGRRSDEEDVKRLSELVSSYPGVLGVYDIIMHNYGPNHVIASVHIEVKDDTTAYEIHQLTRMIQMDVYQKLGIILTIGIYASNEINKYQELKKDVYHYLDLNKNILQIHGFYVNESLHLVTFDVVFSFDETEIDKCINDMSNELKEKYPQFNFSIIVDKDYSV